MNNIKKQKIRTKTTNESIVNGLKSEHISEVNKVKKGFLPHRQ